MVDLVGLHGLVHANQVLEPYDVTLEGAGRAERREWSRRVLAALDERVALRTGDLAEIHAGSEGEFPTEGMPLGRQLAFYAEAKRQ